MKNYIIDTHTLIWRLLKSPKLSEGANQSFDEALEGKALLVIPSIVLLELFFVLQKHRLAHQFPEIISHIENSPFYQVYPLDLSVIKEVSKIKDIQEAHDRVIVATAKMTNGYIVTKDAKIKSLYPRTIW